MAKRAKKPPLWASAIMLLLYFLVYVAPAAILGVLIYYEIKAGSLARKLVARGVPSDDHFKAWRETLLAERARCLAGADELWLAGADGGIATRIDGQFDARSREGRRLNQEISEFEQAADDLTSQFDELTSLLAARQAARIGPGVWIIAAGLSTRTTDVNLKGNFLIGSVAAIVAGFAFFFAVRARLRKS